MFAPKYYPKFHCIADKCRHSCCVGWEIDVDERMQAVYGALSGEIGKEIRDGIRVSEEGACFVLRADGRCPMLDERGLCRIISGLGEGYLCDICREHPRFYHTAGGRLEVGVGAACEEAARLILSEDGYGDMMEIEEEENKTAPVLGDFDVLKVREALYGILSDRTLAYGERLVRLGSFVGGRVLTDAELVALFSRLEYLDEAHRGLFLSFREPPTPSPESAVCAERFLAYLIYRHVSAQRDETGAVAALFAALHLERIFRYLTDVRGLSPVESAVMLSEEIEYSEENTEAFYRACGGEF